MRLAALLAVSVLLGWVGSDWMRRVMLRLDRLHHPTARSSHTRPMPSGGGVGIVVASSVIGIWLMRPSSPLTARPDEILPIVLTVALLLGAIGLVDDFRQLSARVRFGVQLMVCTALLASLGEMPGIGNFIPASSLVDGGSGTGKWVLLSLLLLAGLWWINLFNFMDGIDGIAGSQAIVMLLGGAGLAAWARPEVVTEPTWVWELCVAAATAGFMILNWPPAKIFMGDVGSTWLAFVIFAVGLAAVRNGWLDYAVGVVLGALFVSDASVTLLRRMLAGEHWYQAHRSHAYQHLARRWGGHRPVTLLVIAIDLLWLLPLAWACLAWPDWTLAWLAMAYLPLLAGALLLGAGRQDPA